MDLSPGSLLSFPGLGPAMSMGSAGGSGDFCLSSSGGGSTAALPNTEVLILAIDRKQPLLPNSKMDERKQWPLTSGGARLASGK